MAKKGREKKDTAGAAAAEAMTAEKFGDIMNEFLTKQHVQMLLDSKEGTQDVEITSNVGELGPTVDLFFTIMAAKATIARLLKMWGGKEAIDINGVIDGILDMLKTDLLEAVEEMDG